MGAQSRTGKARAKRDGVPLDAKTRKKLAAAASATRPGITYAQKREAERAARDAKKRSGDSGRASNDGEMRRETPRYGPLEVRYRALAKKLRQIEALEAREQEGEGMDAFCVLVVAALALGPGPWGDRKGMRRIGVGVYV